MIAKNNIFNIRKGPKAWKGETLAKTTSVFTEAVHQCVERDCATIAKAGKKWNLM